MNEIAEMVKRIVGEDVNIISSPTDDNRSYHISSEKIRRELGFTPTRTIEDAIRDLTIAFKKGVIKDPMKNVLYYNIKTLQSSNLI